MFCTPTIGGARNLSRSDGTARALSDLPLETTGGARSGFRMRSKSVVASIWPVRPRNRGYEQFMSDCTEFLLRAG